MRPALVQASVTSPPGGARELEDVLARLHFAGHPRLDEMRVATEPMIAARLAAGVLRDDGALLVARQRARKKCP